MEISKDKMPALNRRSQSAMSLVSVLVGIAILGILAPIGMQMTSNSMAAIKRVSNLREREDLRNTLRVRVNCVATYPTPASGASTTVLKTKSGAPVGPVGADGWQSIGNWKFIALSRNAVGEITLRAKNTKVANSEVDLFQDGAPFVCAP